MKKDRLEVCIWKAISERDKIKRATGNGCPTLSEDKKCYKCNGNDKKYGAYEPQEERSN